MLYSVALYGKARIYLDMDNYKEALKFVNKTLEIRKLFVEENDYKMANALALKAKIVFCLNDFENADILH